MNVPALYFRCDREREEEYAVAKKIFGENLVDSRVGVVNRTVIGRYSVLPYYQELEADLKMQGSSLINTYAQHRYIANFDYYHDIPKGMTPKTWFNFVDIDEEGPYVVKGLTNSRKGQWNTMMFAETKRQAVEIANDLLNDPLIGPQGVIVRKYVPLVTYEIGINGLPFTNEWRFFFYGRNIMCYNYYWSIADGVPGTIDFDGINFAKKIAKIISTKVPFFVIDVAEKAEGGWTLIEVNDGQMSGLSCNDPEVLYNNLYWILQCPQTLRITPPSQIGSLYG